MKKNRYLINLTVTDKQLKVIEDALDMYTRVGIGQLEIVGEKIVKLFPKKQFPYGYWDMRTKIFDPLKNELFGFQPGASYGAGNEETSDDASIGFDLQKVIQKVIATEEEHSQTSVWHHGPILHLGSEPIAKAEVVSKYDKEQIMEKWDEIQQMKEEMKVDDD